MFHSLSYFTQLTWIDMILRDTNSRGNILILAEQMLCREETSDAKMQISTEHCSCGHVALSVLMKIRIWA